MHSLDSLSHQSSCRGHGARAGSGQPRSSTRTEVLPHAAAPRPAAGRRGQVALCGTRPSWDPDHRALSAGQPSCFASVCTHSAMPGQRQRSPEEGRDGRDLLWKARFDRLPLFVADGSAEPAAHLPPHRLVLAARHLLHDRGPHVSPSVVPRLFSRGGLRGWAEAGLIRLAPWLP